jgi:hypothetical protein
MDAQPVDKGVDQAHWSRRRLPQDEALGSESVPGFLLVVEELT